MDDLLLRLSNFSHWQVDALAIGLFLQGAVFTVFPEEIVLACLGVCWSSGKISFFEGMLSAQIGLLTANATVVFVGSRFGMGLLGRAPFRWLFRPKNIDHAMAKLRAHGVWLVVLTRFTPMVRGPIYFATGVFGMQLRHFMRADALASFVQIPLLMLLGQVVYEGHGKLNVGVQALVHRTQVGDSLKLGAVVLGDGRRKTDVYAQGADAPRRLSDHLFLDVGGGARDRNLVALGYDGHCCQYTARQGRSYEIGR